MKKEETALTTVQNNQVASVQPVILRQSFQMNTSVFDVFQNGTRFPFDEIPETWNPTVVGESKRLLFLEAGIASYTQDDGSVKNAGVVYFAELRSLNNEYYLKKVKMGAIRIVSHLCDIVTDGTKNKNVLSIVPKAGFLNTMWDISFLGTEKSQDDPKRLVKVFQTLNVFIPAQ